MLSDVIRLATDKGVLIHYLLEIEKTIQKCDGVRFTEKMKVLELVHKALNEVNDHENQT